MRGVGLGGGHGTAVVLQALSRICTDVTGVVSVADNGGSSGLLRELLGIPAVGDIRRCLGATASPENHLGTLIEQRIGGGAHPLGNLVLAAAVQESPSMTAAVHKVATLVESNVQVLPASNSAVDLVAETASGEARGQVEVHRRRDIQRVRTEPSTAVATEEVVRAIMNADLIVAGPGSLFTSVLATLVVPGVRETIQESSGRFVWVANLQPEFPESDQMSPREQFAAFERHGFLPDVVLCDASLRGGDFTGLPVIFDVLAEPSGAVHSPYRLAQALHALMAN